MLFPPLRERFTDPPIWQTSASPSSPCLCYSENEKKKELVFLFPFPENKENRENSEQVRTFLVFFTSIAPNSACLEQSLLFCSVTLQELQFTFFLLTLC